MRSGLSGAKVAKEIGVTRGTYSKYENVDSGVLPTLETFMRLAEFFNVSPGVLVGRDPSSEAFSPWLIALAPELEALDKAGREAVRALVKGLRK